MISRIPQCYISSFVEIGTLVTEIPYMTKRALRPSWSFYSNAMNRSSPNPLEQSTPNFYAKPPWVGQMKVFGNGGRGQQRTTDGRRNTGIL